MGWGWFFHANLMSMIQRSLTCQYGLMTFELVLNLLYHSDIS